MVAFVQSNGGDEAPSTSGAALSDTGVCMPQPESPTKSKKPRKAMKPRVKTRAQKDAHNEYMRGWRKRANKKNPARKAAENQRLKKYKPPHASMTPEKRNHVNGLRRDSYARCKGRRRLRELLPYSSSDEEEEVASGLLTPSSSKAQQLGQASPSNIFKPSYLGIQYEDPQDTDTGVQENTIAFASNSPSNTPIDSPFAEVTSNNAEVPLDDKVTKQQHDLPSTASNLKDAPEDIQLLPPPHQPTTTEIRVTTTTTLLLNGNTGKAQTEEVVVDSVQLPTHKTDLENEDALTKKFDIDMQDLKSITGQFHTEEDFQEPRDNMPYTVSSIKDQPHMTSMHTHQHPYNDVTQNDTDTANVMLHFTTGEHTLDESGVQGVQKQSSAQMTDLASELQPNTEKLDGMPYSPSTHTARQELQALNTIHGTNTTAANKDIDTAKSSLHCMTVTPIMDAHAGGWVQLQSAVHMIDLETEQAANTESDRGFKDMDSTESQFELEREGGEKQAEMPYNPSTPTKTQEVRSLHTHEERNTSPGNTASDTAKEALQSNTCKPARDAGAVNGVLIQSPAHLIDIDSKPPPMPTNRPASNEGKYNGVAFTQPDSTQGPQIMEDVGHANREHLQYKLPSTDTGTIKEVQGTGDLPKTLLLHGDGFISDFMNVEPTVKVDMAEEFHEQNEEEKCFIRPPDSIELDESSSPDETHNKWGVGNDAEMRTTTHPDTVWQMTMLGVEEIADCSSNGSFIAICDSMDYATTEHNDQHFSDASSDSMEYGPTEHNDQHFSDASCDSMEYAPTEHSDQHSSDEEYFPLRVKFNFPNRRRKVDGLLHVNSDTEVVTQAADSIPQDVITASERDNTSEGGMKQRSPTATQCIPCVSALMEPPADYVAAAVQPSRSGLPSDIATDTEDGHTECLKPTQSYPDFFGLISNVALGFDDSKCTDEYWEYQTTCQDNNIGVPSRPVTDDPQQYTTFRGRVLGPICQFATLALDVTGKILQETQDIAATRDISPVNAQNLSCLKGGLVELHDVLGSLQSLT